MVCLPALAARLAWVEHEVRIAAIEDQVHPVGFQASQHAFVEIARGQIALAVIDIAVAGEN